MEITSTFLIQNMYVILLTLTVIAFFLAGSLRYKIDIKRVKINLLFCFSSLIMILGTLSILVLSIFSFRVEEHEFAINPDCLDSKIEKSCIFSKPGIYFSSHNVIFFSSKPIKIDKKECRAQEYFQSKIEHKCLVYFPGYALDVSSIELLNPKIIVLTVMKADGEYYWNYAGARNSTELIDSVLGLMVENKDILLPSWMGRVYAQPAQKN